MFLLEDVKSMRVEKK